MAFSGFYLALFLLLISLTFSSSLGSSEFHLQPISGREGENGLVLLRRSLAGAPSNNIVVENSSFTLAASRTHRKDPLNNFKYYTGGWNISNKHYWASVGFSAAPLFIIAAVWFVVFGLVLNLICCYYCCCPRRTYTYSRSAYVLSLLLLTLFTIAAIIGCVVLYNGQGKFHSSTSSTLEYVVGQANITVESLRNFSDNLGAAKSISVDQVFLPADVQGRIDAAEIKLNTSANDLQTRTSDNSQKIEDVLNNVRLALIIVAAVMLLLAFLGFLFSILGMQFLVYFLVIVGWVLVTGTFILCGVFLILHNVVADTCVAMDGWVNHPTEHTALDDILPCVDVATANESLSRGKEVTFQLANVINQVINSVANGNFPPNSGPLYYNQSGPLMPDLCNPFTSNFSNRTCITGEVDLDNASQVWRSYVCNTSVASGSEVCNTVGRVTPKIYSQMTAAVKVSYGLYHYGPFLAQLEDCTFVRQTFSDIHAYNCPGLGKYSRWIYIGLAMVSAAVMLSLIFWVIYARERRHRVYSKVRSGQSPFQKGDS